MAGDLHKMINLTDGGARGPLHWGRSSLDGMPFRGDKPPLYKEDEYEERTVRVADFKNGTFDVRDPIQNQNYRNVMDGVVCGWFELVYVDRKCDPTQAGMIYIEWVEYFREDGQSVPHIPSGTEAQGGSSNGGTYPVPRA